MPSPSHSSTISTSPVKQKTVSAQEVVDKVSKTIANLEKAAQDMEASRTGLYDHFGKKAFHAAAKKYATLVAATCLMRPEDFDLRTNPGGPAVSGETTLHHEKLYVQISVENGKPMVLWRTCEGRKDYSGGPNNWGEADKAYANIRAFWNKTGTVLMPSPGY